MYIYVRISYERRSSWRRYRWPVWKQTQHSYAWHTQVVKYYTRMVKILRSKIDNDVTSSLNGSIDDILRVSTDLGVTKS